MMTFGRPWALLLLAIPVLLIVWEVLRTHRAVALPFDHGAPGPRPLAGPVRAGRQLAAGACCWPWRF